MMIGLPIGSVVPTFFVYVIYSYIHEAEQEQMLKRREVAEEAEWMAEEAELIAMEQQKNERFKLDYPKYLSKLLLENGLSEDIAKLCLKHNLKVDECRVIYSHRWDISLVKDYINKKFTWETCLKINEQKLEIDMSMEVVEAMFGSPDASNEKVLKTKVKDTWKYYGTRDSRKVVVIELTFDDKKLVKWEKDSDWQACRNIRKFYS